MHDLRIVGKGDKKNLVFDVVVDGDLSHSEQTRTELARIIARNEKIESMHDLRIVGKGDKKNLVFDVVVDGDLSHSEEEELKNWVNDEIQKIHPNYNCVILVDKNYVKRHF